MAKRKALRYSIRLFDKRGRRVALAKLRYAVAYEIFYGQRRLIARKNFPKMLKRVGERRDLLSALVESIESKRLRLNERKRKQREKAKLEAAKKKAKAKVRRQLRKPVPEKLRAKKKLTRTDQEDPMKVALFDGWQESRQQVLVFPRAFAAPAATALRATVIDTMIIPIAPDGGHYTKRVVDKEMIRSDVGSYHLSILDFSLDEGHFIPLSQDTFREQFKVAFRTFTPHIRDYFDEMQKTSEHFILRIKFLNAFSQNGKLTDHGLSYFRTHIKDYNGMLQLFNITMQQFQGDHANMGPTSRNKLRRNYLEGERTVYLTGFTLEATTLP